MRYAAAIRTDSPELVDGPRGQWINYQGARGRFCGRRDGVTWIAWGRTATHRWAAFVEAFKGTKGIEA